MSAAQPPHRLRILHIEPSLADHAKARAALELNGSDYAIERIETLAELSDRLDRQVCDVIVAAYHVNGFTAMDAWDIVLGAPGVQPPFIVLSDSAGEADAIDAIRRGVSDFVRKSALPDLPRDGPNLLRRVPFKQLLEAH